MVVFLGLGFEEVLHRRLFLPLQKPVAGQAAMKGRKRGAEIEPVNDLL
jgi:hypothetical protein